MLTPLISPTVFKKDLAELWRESLPNESEIGRYKRINATKRFMEYMFAKGYPVFQFRDIKAPRKNFRPYIYSDDEIRRYFEAVDTYEPSVNKKNRIQIPVLFRIIYCCGTRITETLRIRKCDVDLDAGIIRLSETKNKKQRYVVMSPSLHELMKEYASKTFFLLSDKDYIFTTLKGTAIDADIIRDLHIMFLSQAGIPYLSGGTGPRIHDWRHTFAVNSFRQMIENGHDMYVSLPIISAYMGHDSIAATEKYLRLTESMYPYLEDKFSKTINEIFEEGEKHVSISTRNQRLAAFKCFASFLKYERPEYIATAIQIQGIVPKKHQMKEITYLKPEGIRLLMSQADRSTINGRRDYTMMCVLFLTGIRVSELISLRGRDISMESPRTLVVHGKGNKIRHIAIVKQLSDILEPYLNEHKSLLPCNLDKPVFKNHSGSKFTRQGINFMLSKYARSAREINPKIVPEDCSPHKIRHSTAMALVEQGTDLIIIRDLLGHSSVQTTEIYAKVSTARRRAAIEASSKQLVDEERPLWEENTGLKEWLKGLTNKKLM